MNSNKIFIASVIGILLLGVGLLVVNKFSLFNRMTTSFTNIENTQNQINILDINNDGIVNDLDLDLFERKYQEEDIVADMDKNGKVEFNDFALYMNKYPLNQ